ncbi:MAG TPA: hypothetical protein VG637_03165, partial [Actinomycetes bacterium]|nr:hypothetical protein [Actinomycetes bacterium]
PHHVTLTDEAARSYDPVFKVNPPLREKTDVEAVRLGLADHGKPILPGRPANLCVIDPRAQWVVRPDFLASRSRNTPFHGRELRGRVVHTLLRGAFTVRDGRAQR